MDTRLDSLAPVFKPKAYALLARATEARIPVIIVNTRRSAAEQAACIARGASWVAHSKHEDGLAIDIAPLSAFLLHGANKVLWDADPVWTQLGALGEALGLVWGGRWTDPRPDWGHFEQGT